MEKWTQIEIATGVAKPGSDERAKFALDEKIKTVEAFWLATDTVNNAGFSPRLQYRYNLMLTLMFRLQMSIGEVLSLRGSDLVKHASKLKTVPLPKVENFAFVFQSPHKQFIPLSRARVVEDLFPYFNDGNFENWQSADNLDNEAIAA